jgi:hypothetical protein
VLGLAPIHLNGEDLGKILRRIAAYWTSKNWLKTAENSLQHPYFIYWGCRGRGFESRRSDQKLNE